MKATTARVLQNRGEHDKNKEYPLAIRVTFNRKPTPFPIGLKLTEADFKKLKSPRLGEHLSQIKDKFILEEKRAQTIIDNLGTFTFPAFREEFYKGLPDLINSRRKKAKKNDLPMDIAGHSLTCQPGQNVKEWAKQMLCEGKNKKYGNRKFDRIRSNVDYKALGPLAELYGAYITELESQERIGTSESYFSSITSLLKLKPFLRVEDVTVKFLYGYESWFLSQGNSITTVGIYLRPLRCILNIQKDAGLLSPKDYPFGKRKYQIPTGANYKIALEKPELKKLWDYQFKTEDKSERFALAIWFFGFFTNGINTKDIACLKYKNIQGDFIVLLREKTKFTTRTNPKPITIPINEQMLRIIECFGIKNKTADSYIFPVLQPGLSAHRQRELVQGFTAFINDWMKKIAPKAGVNKNVSTKVWRHTFATILKRSGVSTEFISEALGHYDLKTTENYLDSFELEAKRKIAAKLTSFMVSSMQIGFSNDVARKLS